MLLLQCLFGGTGCRSPPSARGSWLQAEHDYVRMLEMNSLKRFEYCSGFTVEISAPACRGDTGQGVKVGGERGVRAAEPLC